MGQLGKDWVAKLALKEVGSSGNLLGYWSRALEGVCGTVVQFSLPLPSEGKVFTSVSLAYIPSVMYCLATVLNIMAPIH